MLDDCYVFKYIEESPNIGTYLYVQHVVGNSHQYENIRGASRDA